MNSIDSHRLWMLVLACAGFWPWEAGARPGQSLEEAKEHWAYQPIRRPELPPVQAKDLVRTPVDAFLLAKLEAEGLGFSPRADARSLLRRVFFDLVGLPPRYEEIEAFSREPSARAYEAVVDRLLADPRYGERWGRHWLDVARYADTKDLVLLYGRDAIRPYAYTYRDYVIRAFNEDLPFDEFIRDQVAADLVEPALPPWRLAALGFITLGRLFDNNPHDQIDDQIDTVTRGFMGMTVACARCHDHKYDAIVMEDYYGLYGIFASTQRPYLGPLIDDPKVVPGGPEFEAKLAKAVYQLEQHIDSEFAKLTDILRGRVGDYIFRAATTPPDITETTQFALSLTPDDFRPELMLRTRRFLERRIKAEDRVFGLWAGLMELPDGEFESRAGELINGGSKGRAGAPEGNALVMARFKKELPTRKEDIPRIYAEIFREQYRALKARPCDMPAYLVMEEERELSDILLGEDGPVWFPRRDTPDYMSRPDKDHYNGLALNLDKIAAHAELPPPARAMVVADLARPYDSRVFNRGNPSRPDRPAPRGFIRVLNGGNPKSFGPGSGRLELAKAIQAPDNPLTARVLVNRVWMHHFGEPLVGSTTDFGVRSEPPANPGLLDWLASELIDSGWRLKHLHRTILLSSAYQQTSRNAVGATRIAELEDPGGEGFDRASSSGAPPFADPEGGLLGQFPRRRLDLESMRDSMLFASGLLDQVMGGRPVDVAGDPLNQRRTVYGLVDRQNLPSLFRSFDFAVPDQCVERRSRTTVPQQALFAMNSRFVIEQAKALAALPEVGGELDSRARVDVLFRRALGRSATDDEAARALRFVEGSGVEAKLSGWEQLAQVLLVSNEAVFID